jgi:hypothetical protein
MKIEWDEKLETSQRVCLAVLKGVTVRHASRDDLLKACESTGLECVPTEMVEATRRALDAGPWEPTSDAATRMHNDWVDARERAEGAEETLTQALTVGLAECERLRELYAVSDALRMIAIKLADDSANDLRNAWNRIDELETPFRELGIGRHAGESIAAFIKRVCVADRAYHHNVRRRASQGFAISGEQAKELVDHFESCLEELRNERDGAVANRAAAIASAEKAEARIAELEAALTNAANGIGVNDAGPVVYAAAAVGKPLAFSSPGDAPRFSITEDEAATRDADSRDAALIRARTDASLRPIKAAIESARLRAEELLGTRALPRATDEELMKITKGADSLPDAISRVAARVRRDQCLVTRAVSKGKRVTVGNWRGEWEVIVDGVTCWCASADVPATLDRMLGEVSG